jgi:hypothetical protein
LALAVFSFTHSSQFKSFACGAKIRAHGQSLTALKVQLAAISSAGYCVCVQIYLQNLLHKGTVFSGLACGALVCAIAQRSPPSRYTRNNFYLLLWFQNRPWSLDCEQICISNFFIKRTPFQGFACGARLCAHAHFITALKVQLDAISGAWRFVCMQICFKIECTKA